MNITSGLIYWISRLDALQGVFTIAGFITFVTLIILGIFIGMAKAECDDKNEKAFKHAFKKTAIICTIAIFGAVLIPTSKEMAAAIVIPKIANSEQIQDIGDGIYNLALEWMEELSPKNHKDNK